MKEMTQYIDSLYENDELITNTLRDIQDRGMSAISISPGYGRLLTLLVQISGASRILEIGALGGVSGIYLTRGLGDDGKLVSLELKQAYADTAKSNLEAAGVGDKVEYRVGEALTSLAQLEEEGQTFDFYFIDADKENYPRYLDYAIRLAKPGAIIVGDNTLLRGRVADPDKQSPSVVAMRHFNETFAQDPRLESTVIPAYDGLSIARVKAQ